MTAAGRFVWCLSGSAPETQSSAQSPDHRLMATLSRSARHHFWRAGIFDHCAIKIIAADGRRLRNIVVEEKAPGWIQDSSIRWAADSSSVTFTFMNDEAETKQFTVNFPR